MEHLQRMMDLRPYKAGVSNIITMDLEDQLQNSFESMKVADFIAFAEGAEAYILTEYKGHGTGLSGKQGPLDWCNPVQEEPDVLLGEIGPRHSTPPE